MSPLSDDSGFAARSASADRADRWAGESSTNDHAAPPWGQPDAYAGARQEGPRDGSRRARWWWTIAPAVTRFRHSRLALVVIAGVVTLCMVLGVAALGNAFQHSQPNSTPGVLSAGRTPGVASSSGRTATPGATMTTTRTVAPGNTQPPTPLTVAITCSSGVAGGTGQLCVHTLPHAALSLSVRYCDGSNAKGKAFHSVSYADSGGNYTWRWNVTTTCTGAATATVTAKSAGQTVTQTTTFAVTR